MAKGVTLMVLSILSEMTLPQNFWTFLGFSSTSGWRRGKGRGRIYQEGKRENVDNTRNQEKKDGKEGGVGVGGV